uniref:Uncharacterized protein n=1 Tax=Human herpesvirus 1 TaxID=10298 RepID=A0A2Z4H026_HHV1|nr:hypothetical protein [Human alphaherpesvirus 1]
MGRQSGGEGWGRGIHGSGGARGTATTVAAGLARRGFVGHSAQLVQTMLSSPPKTPLLVALRTLQ